jgi:hypothetical protein
MLKAQRYKIFTESIQNQDSITKALRIGSFVLQRLGSAISSSLPALILFLRFQEWWSTTDYSKSKDELPIPPPPDTVSPHHEGLAIPSDGACPICKHQIVNSTMLMGVVYCYSCIFSYVQERQRCPVTLQIAHPDMLRKIYEN